MKRTRHNVRFGPIALSIASGRTHPFHRTVPVSDYAHVQLLSVPVRKQWRQVGLDVEPHQGVLEIRLRA